MTSGSLFFKLTWKDFKQRIWCPILLCVIFFLVMEVGCLMRFQEIDAFGELYSETKLSFFRDGFLMVDAMGSIVSFFMVCSAVLCGLSSYTYLNSKKQIDMYHSLPVHRTVLFFSRFVSGIICFAVPFLLNLGITFLIAIGRRAVDGVTIGRLFVFIGFQMIYFLSIYSVTVLAVMLTGNLVLNAMGTAVLLSYSPVLWVTVMLMSSTFFDTFVSWCFERPFCLSPIQDIFEVAAKINEQREYQMIVSYGPAVKSLLIECVVIIALIIIDWRLFLKRPSETAGKSIVFPIAEPIIKTAFLLPVSLACGVFFMNAASSGETFAWFVFGSVFGFFFIGIVMEIIYRLDIKSAFCHWKYLLLNLGVLVIIIAIYKFDLFGYDRYMPGKDNVESMAISISSLDTQIDYNRYTSHWGFDGYRIENMRITDVDVPYALCERVIAQQDALRNVNDEGTPVYNSTSEYIANIDKMRATIVYTTVAYRQKNGKVVYRSYYMDTADTATFELMDKLYCMEEYKKGVFPIFEDVTRPFYKMECNMKYNSKILKLDQRKTDEFLAVYRDDLKNLSLQTVFSQLPIGSLYLCEKWDRDGFGTYTSGSSYPLYPEFSKTIAWLKTQGVDYTEQKEPDKLLSVRVWNYSQSYETAEGWSENANILYEDEATMKEILSHAVCIYDLELSEFSPIERWMDVDVEYENEDGSNFRTFYFKRNEIPDFVVQDLDNFVPEEDEMEMEY